MSTQIPGPGDAGPDEKPAPESPAQLLVQLRLGEQVDQLRDGTRRLTLGEPAVHPTRVALRRLRAALGTFASLLDEEVTEPVRADLQWAARELGQARDDEVVSETLTALLAEEPDAAVPEAMLRRMQSDLRPRESEEVADPRVVLDADRYQRLLAALEGLVAAPPWTEAASRPAHDVLPPLVTKDWKRLRRRIWAAVEAEGLPHHDEALHDARKAAKRLRYAAETLKPAFEAAGRLAKQAEALQALLGDHQDAVVARQRVLLLAEAADRDGASSFGYGRLDARLQLRAESLAADVPRVWAEVVRPQHNPVVGGRTS